MKRYVWSLLWVLMACKTQPNSGDCAFKLDYESAFATIRIAEGKLFYSRTEYDIPENSPVAHGEPKTTVIYNNKALSANQIADLQTLITNSGFYALERPDYGAGQDHRYYPYTIHIEQACRQKEVLFRSNPDADAAPAAFTTVEAALMKLVGK